MKLGLLLLKTAPVTGECHSFQAPANVFYGCQLKAHLPIYHSKDTCTLATKNSASDKPAPLSKFGEQEKVWVKLDNNTKWMDGEIIQVLPNQSYMVKLSGGQIFQRNQHHITRRPSCLKPRATGEAVQDTKSYNLRPRKTVNEC